MHVGYSKSTHCSPLVLLGIGVNYRRLIWYFLDSLHVRSLVNSLSFTIAHWRKPLHSVSRIELLGRVLSFFSESSWFMLADLPGWFLVEKLDPPDFFTIPWCTQSVKRPRFLQLSYFKISIVIHPHTYPLILHLVVVGESRYRIVNIIIINVNITTSIIYRSLLSFLFRFRVSSASFSQLHLLWKSNSAFLTMSWLSSPSSSSHVLLSGLLSNVRKSRRMHCVLLISPHSVCSSIWSDMHDV